MKFGVPTALPSPWPHLLESNDAPNEVEITSIRQFILEHQARLEILDNQAPATLSSSSRDALAYSIQRHRSILSAVRRVPPELWSEIFELLTPFTRYVGPAHAVDSPPWPLTFICRSWRDTALLNPFLWCTINIVRPTQLPLVYTHPLSSIETQLHRSAKVPLKVSVDWWGGEDAAEESLLDLLILHSSRWRTFQARIMGRDIGILGRLQGVRTHIPQLRKFSCISRTNLCYTTPEHALTGAPSLREIILADATSHCASPRFYVPWAQITRCQGVFDTRVQLEIMFAAPNLVQCTMSSTSALVQVPPPDMGIAVLPHLRRLCLDEDFVLNHISAPALEELRLEGPLDLALPFFQRSASSSESCPLTKLVLDQGWTDDAPCIILQVLKLLPALELLMMDRFPGTEPQGFWNAMTLSESESGTDCKGLCPNLTSIACPWLRDDASETLTIEAFFTMLRSRRRRHCGGLKSVRLLTFPCYKYIARFEEAQQRLAEELVGIHLPFLFHAQWDETMERCRFDYYE
ncbi:hypothetical protein FB45DRAFT_1060378 [Roridomyces roridus]|uniref:F-box domain-containing protein n=1 Tax=Roridomyces roridus TaxID=1738132 RepID=A0AAD7FKT4_9AGAR|nr:hypothetical protein FB45DRAFT_1060378 [Roridomyces roridus]